MSINPISRKEAIHFVPSVEKKDLPPGISSGSSIAPADSLSFSSFQPKHNAPNVMFSVIWCYRREEDGMYLEAIVFDQESKSIFLEKKLSKEQSAKILEEEMKAVKSSNTWTSLGVATQWIAFAAAVTVGLNMGGAPGVALLIGGGVALGTRALIDSGLLDTALAHFNVPADMRNTIFKGMEAGLSAMSLGLGLFTGYSTYLNPAILSSNTLTHLTSCIQIAGTVNGLSIEAGKAFSNWRMANIKQDLEKIRQQLQCYSFQETDLMEDMKRSSELMANETRALHYAINAAQA